MTSLPMWAIMLSHFASNYGNYLLMILLPTYMTFVLKFDIKKSGILNALPFALQMIVAILGGKITDLLIQKNVFRIITIRKINTTIGLIVPAICLVVASYLGCYWQHALVFFTLSAALNAMTIPGCKANILDLSPRYSGILLGISNTLANFTGFLTPAITGLFIDLENGSISQWRSAFWFAAGIYLIGSIFYLIFASGEEQNWSKGVITSRPDKSEDEE